MARCVVCEAPTSGSLEFCKKDYKLHQSDIEERRPWVKALKNDAQKERRRREREYGDESLDELMDIVYQKPY